MFIDDCATSRNYTIANSLRLRSSASAYLSRTPSASNRKTWTWSGLVKRGTLGSNQPLFMGRNNGTNYDYLRWNSDDTLYFFGQNAGVDSYRRNTTQVFRDPSSWYHIVAVLDTTQATASNRVKLYVNGSQVTAFTTSTDPTLNFDSYVNSAVVHFIGGNNLDSSYSDQYLSDVYFIDGQALTPSSFGQTDTNGVWVPKSYSGTYGTNGFYLKFNDGSSTTNLCLDRSGNGNNWTPSGISVTAGATYDWMVDTPTNVYCTFNAVNKNSSVTVSNANLQMTATSAAFQAIWGTMGVSSGKWYFEFTVMANVFASNGVDVGVALATASVSQGPGATSVAWLYDNNNTAGAGRKSGNGAISNYGATYTTNDVIGVALDMGAGSIEFYKNNVSQGVAFASGVTGEVFPFATTYGTDSVALNCGQRPFTYTPPTGFKALCTANLPAVTIANPKKHFDVVLYTGNAASPRTITGAGFQPDLIWDKSRSARSHTIWDSVRGVGASKELSSNITDAEGGSTINTAGFGYVSAITSDGFTLTTGSTNITAVNSNGEVYAAWLWKANGTGVTNTAGSITSTVSANTTAGFSIVTYTGTGANATVGHGLGTVPKMVIVKNRTGGIGDWLVWHSLLAATDYLVLNTTAAKATSSLSWNNTAPTSSVFSIGTSTNVNWNTNTHVAYVFSEVPGFSKFGSYTGNGSADGPFLYFGFRARYICYKRTDTTGNWNIIDTARNPYNQLDTLLRTNLSNADETNSVYAQDITANGWKIRSTNVDINVSGATYIFMAFAESPFGASNTAPATAR